MCIFRLNFKHKRAHKQMQTHSELVDSVNRITFPIPVRASRFDVNVIYMIRSALQDDNEMQNSISKTMGE